MDTAQGLLQKNAPDSSQQHLCLPGLQVALRSHFPVHRVQWMLKCSNVMNPFLHVQHPAPLLARYKVITRPLESCSTELRHLPEPQPTAETHHPYKPPAAFSCSFHTALTTSRTRARGCSSQLNSPSVPQEGPHSRPCPNTSPSAGVPWAAAVSCHVCSVPLVGGTASALPWGTSCHTFALGFKPAPFDVTC